MLAPFFDYVRNGGFVMYPLVLATFVLWYCLGYRFASLRRGDVRAVRVILERRMKGTTRKPHGVIDRAAVQALDAYYRRRPQGLRRRLDEEFAVFEDEIGRLSVLVRGIVAAAPLLGLLGTVTGMIETFDALGDMSLFSQSGGIAGGISQALITTQLGLAVAVPGHVVGRVLDRRERTIRLELDQIKDHVCAMAQVAAPEAET